MNRRGFLGRLAALAGLLGLGAGVKAVAAPQAPAATPWAGLALISTTWEAPGVPPNGRFTYRIRREYVVLHSYRGAKLRRELRRDPWGLVPPPRPGFRVRGVEYLVPFAEDKVRMTAHYEQETLRAA